MRNLQGERQLGDVTEIELLRISNCLFECFSVSTDFFFPFIFSKALSCMILKNSFYWPSLLSVFITWFDMVTSISFPASSFLTTCV